MTAKSKDASSPASTEAAFYSLLRTFGLLRQVMEPYFARFGISGSQWAILRVLQRAQEQGEAALRLTDLGQRLLIQPPSVTGTVDRLERQGLVRRHGSKADLRVREVGLTPAGRKLVAKVLGAHSRQIESLFAGHRPNELQRLAALLRQLEAHLGTLVSPQSNSIPEGRSL